MLSKHFSNKGVAPVVLLVGIFVVGVLGFGVYKTFIENNTSRNTTPTQVFITKYLTQPQIQTPTPVPVTPPPSPKPSVVIATTPPAKPSSANSKTSTSSSSSSSSSNSSSSSSSTGIVSDPKRLNPSPTIIYKKVYLVIFNPKIGSNDTLKQFGWNNPDTITDSVFQFFNSVTDGRVKYTLGKRVVLESFPKKTDGFTYTADTFQKCIKNNSDCHNPDTADYLDILKVTQACELLSSGEIDELWMWGGPYFGFYESNMAGPNAFWLNSGPTSGSTCKKLLPIMGFNYERGLNEAVHDFGHRAESAMKKVYGNWDPTYTNSWNRFSLLNKDIKDKAGCGNTHYTSASLKDYEYSPSGTVKSNCHEYINFPNISGDFRDVSCKTWGCTEFGYYQYWWTHFPQNAGKSTDVYTKQEIKNNWLEYVFDFSWVN